MATHRYLASRIGSVLLVLAPSLCLFVALLQIMRLLPVLAAGGVAPLKGLEVFLLLLVPVATLVLPAACVLSLLIVFARLQGDGELIAFFSCGIGPKKLAIAPAVLCLAVASLAEVGALWAEPHANRLLRSHFADLLSDALEGSLRPGQIVTPASGLTFFVRSRQGDTLHGLFVDDRRGEPQVQLFATQAKVALNPDRALAELMMDEGAVHVFDQNGSSFSWATFERLETELPLEGPEELLAAIVPQDLGMTTSELAARAREASPEATRAQWLLHRRYATGPSAMALALVALFLGLFRRFSARPLAFVVGSGLVLAYHLLARLGEALAGEPSVGPVLGAWVPCVLTLAAAGGAWLALNRSGRYSGGASGQRR